MTTGVDVMARTEDEAELGRAVRAYADRRLPLSDVRLARDLPAGERLHGGIWKELLGLGWPTLNLPIRHGGAAAGLATLGVVAEELGRSLSDLPLVSAAAVASCLVQGTSAPVTEALEGLVTGETSVTMAVEEAASGDPLSLESTAERVGTSYVINGVKVNVADADIADALIIPARVPGADADGGRISLFLVPASAAGIGRSDTLGVDGRWRSRLCLSDVLVSSACVVGDLGGGHDPLKRAFEIGALLTAAEMVGSAAAALDLTLAHLKDRVQFGAPIGSFQALQHRIARAWVALELATSAVREALRIFDDQPDGGDPATHTAKALINDASRLVMAEGLQMHGGLGMTDEASIGLYLKRSRAAEQAFGGSGYHRDRLACALGF